MGLVAVALVLGGVTSRPDPAEGAPTETECDLPLYEKIEPNLGDVDGPGTVDYSGTGQGNGGEGAYDMTDVTAACEAAGYLLLECRNEHDGRTDERKVVMIERSLAEQEWSSWWVDEIETESTTDEGYGCDLAENPPHKRCDQMIRTIEVANGVSVTTFEDYEAPGLIEDKCWGTYPTALFEMSWNEGTNWDPGNWDDNLLGWLTSLMFGIAKGAIQVALWLLEYGLTFDLRKYTLIVDELGATYDLVFVGGLHLVDFVWFALVAWVAFAALRGRGLVAGGEMLFTIVLVSLATILFTNRTSYMNSVDDFMDDSTTAFLGTARLTDEDHEELREGLEPADVGTYLDDLELTETIRGFQTKIHEQFVELPYYYLNWGDARIVDQENCKRAADEVVATGHDRVGWPNRHMRRAGEECRAFARYNKDATDTRMFGALITLVVAIMVALTLILTGFTLTVGKFLVALLFAVTPFAVLAAGLPAAGRRMFWVWCGSLLQLVFAVVLSGGLLGLEITGVNTIVSLTEHDTLFERWFIVLLVVATVYFARRKLLASVQRLATTTTDSLTRLSPGATNYSGGGPVGFDLERVDRTVSGAARGLGKAAAVGTYVGLVGGGLAVTGASRYLGNLSRDVRNRRFSARNLAYNRQALREAEMRPTTTFQIGKDGAVKAVGHEMRVPTPVTRHEARRANQAVQAFGRQGRHPQIDVVDHGSAPSPRRRVRKYRDDGELWTLGSPELGGPGFSPPASNTPGPQPRPPKPSQPKPTPTSPKRRWNQIRQTLKGLGGKAGGPIRHRRPPRGHTI